MLILSVLNLVISEAKHQKRTIDFVLRSVAETFGYDIQKRPSVLQTTPAPVASTFFPPPLAPIPAVAQVPLTPMVPRANPPAVPLGPLFPPLVPPRRVLPASPTLPPLTPVLPPPRLPALPPPRAPLPPPANPPQAPPANPPQPPPQVPPAPPPSSSAKPSIPLLTETIQKTFNINFNWNKNVQPTNSTAAGSPAAAPPAPSAASPSAPTAPAQPPPLRPSAPTSLPGPGGQVFMKKPQLYREYDYVNEGIQDYPEEKAENPRQSEDVEDYPDYQNQFVSQDYSESHKLYAKKQPQVNEQKDSKKIFKESVDAFWRTYPQKEQHGYKYIANPTKAQEKQYFSQNIPKEPRTRYEEYNLPQNKETVNEEKHNCETEQKYIATVRHHDSPKVVTEKYHHENVEKLPNVEYLVEYENNEPYVYLVPKDYVDYEDDVDHNKKHKSHLANKYIDNSEIYPEEQEQIIKQRKVKYETIHNNLQDYRNHRNQPKLEAETVAHPLYSGILPTQLHQLAKSESQSKAWSVPYDFAIESTENKNSVIRNHNANNHTVANGNNQAKTYQFDCCSAASDSNDFYVVPERRRIDLSRYEKLHTDEDSNTGLSKNAKIQTKEKKVSVLQSNKYEQPHHY